MNALLFLENKRTLRLWHINAVDIWLHWDACVWSCVVVRECAVCFCAALCLLGASEEQQNRCYSWSLGVCVCVFAYVCFWWRGSGRLHHRAWKLQWFRARPRSRAYWVQEAVQEMRLQLADTFRQLFNQSTLTVCKVCFKYYLLYLKWKMDECMDTWNFK